jgi:hypothetical protein
MFLSIRTKYWLFLGGAGVLIGLIVFINFSPVFALQRAETCGPYADKVKNDELTPNNGSINLFRFNKEMLADKILAIKGIDKVRVMVKPPHGISVELNQFQPAVLVMARKIYGMDDNCRLIPFDKNWQNINLPVFTGLTVGRMFTAPSDFRVAEVLTGLNWARDEIPQLHNQIAEIDFSDPVYVSIYLTTDSNRYLATSCDFLSQLIKLDAVRSVTAGELGCCYNLQFGGVVIKNK